jgi:hypothetical protein
VYSNKNRENSPDSSQNNMESEKKEVRKSRGKDGIPITTSRSMPIRSTEPLQPTLKLEMFAPPQEPIQRPFGIYDQYIPYIYPGSGSVPKIDFDPKEKKFSRSAFEYLFAPTSAVSYGPNVKMPVQNVYNINLPGPTGGHVEMNKIYENILPGKDGKMTFTTLGERLQMYEYVRQILIKIHKIVY